MSNADWEQLQRLFEKVMALPAERRGEFLDNACAGDHELRAEINALIAADRKNRTEATEPIFLDSVLDPDAELVNATVDDWRIIERVGTGGMGSVFLAERAGDEFEQRAALKIVKKGMDTEIVLQRFRQERQILARLNHPNIARLLDGGMTPDGRPYFAMEYVDGEAITEYCDRHKLTVKERLAIFRKACNAVHYAHRNLVVHRDIKPSNIIVTTDGEVKLLDFGIAKLLGDSGPDDQLTRTGMQVLTPAYAAPEQLLDEAVTTATDVYALGIVLYELLSGRKPFGVRRTLDELRDLVLSGSPPKPSVAVIQQPVDTDGRLSTKTVEEVGAARSERIERLRKHLSGDLDTICLMAMHREPDHRYASVNQMAEDIKRHLNGDPVVASPDSAWYRIGKFYKRNRAAVASAVGVVLAFAAMVFFYTLQLAEERDRAQIEAQRAEATAQFLTEIFEISDPDENAGREVTAKEILDIGAEKLRDDLKLLPATKGALGITIGTVYESLGLYNEAHEQTLRATQLLREAGDPAALADSLRLLGSVHYELGNLESANDAYVEALAINRERLPENHLLIATNLNDLGHNAYAQGKYQEAIQTFEDTIQIYEALNDFSDPGYPDTLHDLGQVQQLLGDLDNAEGNLEDALESAQRVFGDLHSITVTYAHDLAVLLHEKDDFEAAERLYLDVIEKERQVLGADHPDLEVTMTNLGRLYGDMGRWDEAESYLRQAVEHVVRVRGPEHTFVAYDMVNLANLLTSTKQHDEAETLFGQALDIYAKNLSADHPYIASASVGFAALLNQMGRPDESMAHTQTALEISKVSLPDDHWLVASANSVHGESLMLLGNLEDAEPLLLSGYEGVSRARPRDRITTNAVARLIAYYEMTGDADAAEEFRQKMPVR